MTMKPSKIRRLPNLPPPTRIQTRTPNRNPLTLSHSEVLRTIKDPTCTLKQILTAVSSAARFRHSYDTYQTLISLLSRRRQFRLADVILSLMRRLDGLVPGPTASSKPTPPPASSSGSLIGKVFSFLFKTLVIDGQLEVAESLFANAADLGFQIQVRYFIELIKGFCDHLRIGDGIRVFRGMLHAGVSPDVITFSTLMNFFVV